MGKKSKRNKQKDRHMGQEEKEFSDSINLIRSKRLIQVSDEANKNSMNRLYSKAVERYRECIGMFQVFQDPHTMLKRTGSFDSDVLELKTLLYLNLMMAEIHRCRFDNVVQIYNDFQLEDESKHKALWEMCGRLAMLRLSASNENKNKLVSLINHRISEGMLSRDEVHYSLLAVMILRNLKYYDAAIALGEKLPRLNENGVGPTFENVISHLERYRAGCLRQRDKDFANNILQRIQDARNEYNAEPKKALSHRFDAYSMMLAQRNYLCHKIDEKNQSPKLSSLAIENVEIYIERVYLERDCHTCDQAGTEVDVQLVCSGCRVACYCSLDHQRMTWKKDAIQGMRIGHEILCPLMKAYRKWKLASKKSNERVLKLRRRLDRECLYFLSDGLGLKDKCFREDDVRKYFSSQNTCTLL